MTGPIARLFALGCYLLASLVNASSNDNKIEFLPFKIEATGLRVQYQGKIVGGARWRDRNGENLLVLTQTGAIPSSNKCGADESCARDAEVYAYHYIVDAEKTTLLWKLTDFERSCDFDLYAGFLLNSISITDLNSNGVAENTFLYKLSCRSDVSPARLKLIMHEGKNKFAIRGTTKLPADYGGGEMEIDPAFKKAGNPYLKHALEQWKIFAAEDNFEQF